MALIINKVTDNNKEQLINYAAEYGAEHDSSYLPGRDFEFSGEHPSYLLMENNEVVGAVGLMRTKRFLSVNKGRFSIFHSILNTREAYAQLLEAIRPLIQDLKSVYLFIPEEKEEMAAVLNNLGFMVERYSFILERGGPVLPVPDFPDGFVVHPLESTDQEGISQFAVCLNKEFKDLAGHTQSTAEDIQTWFDDQSYIEGGLCLLKKGHEPIGTIGLMKDLDDVKAGEILAFGVLAEYRGRALGRNLFRYGFNFLIDKGLKPVTLSVNGENQGAIKLYETEGFELIEAVVCYTLEDRY